MKKEDLYDAITDIDGKYVEEADRHMFDKNKKASKLISIVTPIAAILIVGLLSVFSITRQSKIENGFLEAPMTARSEKSAEISIRSLVYAEELPEMSPYPNWDDYAAKEDYDGFDKALSKYYKDIEEMNAGKPSLSEETNGFQGKLIRSFFNDTDVENAIVAPSNVYMALAMLAEVTDGDSRNQILEALNINSLEELRGNADIMWRSNYLNAGNLVSILGDSIWLDDDISYNKDTLKTIQKIYHASSYSGDMGDAFYDEELHDWMNRHTGNLLSDQIGSISFSPETILSLVSTIYFKGGFEEEFDKSNTQNEVFHAKDFDVEVSMMHKSDSGTVYFGDNYMATALDLPEGYRMMLVLPNDGLTPKDLINDDDAIKFILSDKTAKRTEAAMVNYSVPKFDVNSQVELSGVLASLGIEDVFTASKSNFTPLTEVPDIELSEVLHGARVKVDEEGVEAAAYTIMMTETMGFFEDSNEIDFVLDRPFIYTINNRYGQPQFVGIVDRP